MPKQKGKTVNPALKQNSINSYFTWIKSWWYNYECHIKHAQKWYYTWQKQSENIELDLKRCEEFTYIYKNLANYCLILTRN